MGEATVLLARRAVACGAWRWLPGMATLPDEPGRTYRHLIGGHLTQETGRRLRGPAQRLADCLPDLADPATLGCLLALVRGAWGEPLICARYSGAHGAWVVDAPLADPVGIAQTEAGALVAALEVARG